MIIIFDNGANEVRSKLQVETDIHPPQSVGKRMFGLVLALIGYKIGCLFLNMRTCCSEKQRKENLHR